MVFYSSPLSDNIPAVGAPQDLQRIKEDIKEEESETLTTGADDVVSSSTRLVTDNFNWHLSSFVYNPCCSSYYLLLATCETYHYMFSFKYVKGKTHLKKS